MARLTWFVSLPGFALVLVGLAVVALRRWRAAAWAVVAADAGAVPALRLQRAELDPAAVVDPALRADRAARDRRGPDRAGDRLPASSGACAAGSLTRGARRRSAWRRWWGCSCRSRCRVRAHDEWRGSFALTRADRRAGRDGADGVFLWEPEQACCAGPTQLLAIPVWLQHGQLSGLLPNDAALEQDAFARVPHARALRRALPRRGRCSSWPTAARCRSASTPPPSSRSWTGEVTPAGVGGERRRAAGRGGRRCPCTCRSGASADRSPARPARGPLGYLAARGARAPAGLPLAVDDDAVRLRGRAADRLVPRLDAVRAARGPLAVVLAAPGRARGRQPDVEHAAAAAGAARRAGHADRRAAGRAHAAGRARLRRLGDARCGRSPGASRPGRGRASPPGCSTASRPTSSRRAPGHLNLSLVLLPPVVLLLAHELLVRAAAAGRRRRRAARRWSPSRSCSRPRRCWRRPSWWRWSGTAVLAAAGPAAPVARTGAARRRRARRPPPGCWPCWPPGRCACSSPVRAG